MRFKINLASQPYENARRFVLEWGAALVVVLILSAFLVFAAVKAWRVNHVLSASISDERARLEKLNDEEKADLDILNKPGNRDVREKAQAINALILRKEFSWTRIFTDLEKMMPSRLHVVSITPQLTDAGDIEIRMSVAGDSRDKAIALVQNIEKAPDFRDPRIISESNATKDKPATQGDNVEFQISAVYVPSAADAMNNAEKQQGATSTPANDERPNQPKASSPVAESRQPTANPNAGAAKGGHR